MNLKIYDPKDFPSYLPKLNYLYDDLFTGGKGFRAKLIHIFAAPLGLSEDLELLLGQTIEFIHNASLLHDDLVDRSQLRRGKPAAWLKYNPEYAVLAGDYLLARVMVNLSGNGNIKLVQFTSQTISDLLEGEWIQDSLMRDYSVTLEQLDRVHNLKTASLFKWCLQAPFYAVKNEDPTLHRLLEELGTLLGLLFQRSDDLLDFNIRNEENKLVLGDLKSGYFNSFSAYLCADFSAERRLEFVKCQTLDEVYKTIPQFELKLSEFDEMNKDLIRLYSHLLGQLKDLLPPQQTSLIDGLRPLSEILYWRKTK